MKEFNLPSKAIKYWWFYRPLDLSDKTDQLIYIIFTVNYINKILKELTKWKQLH